MSSASSALAVGRCLLRRWHCAAAALVLSTSAAAQPDYNRDCVSNFADSIAFMNDYAALSPAADLNLDGTVNQTDFDSFADSRAKTNFTVYWQASNAMQAPPVVDRQTNLSGIPISRNSAMLYQQRFTKMPIRYNDNGDILEAGYQLMFRGLNGSYTSWRQNYDTWNTLHIASLPALMASEVPSPAFNGLVCIDWEAIAPVRQQIFGDTVAEREWDEMLEAINSPTFDQSFLTFTEWTAPAGARGWADLSTEQKTEFANQSYRKVGMAFYLSTVEALRALRPQAKYCFYGQPVGAWLVYDDERKALNDELAPLWAAVDVLAPSTYPLFWTTTDRATSPCPDAVNSPSQNSAFFKSLIDECYRIKERYPRAGGHQIITYAAWHYKDQAGVCSPLVNPSIFVNDLNLLHQLQLPWWYGADGVAIWGHFRNGGYDTPANISQEMQTRWKDPIRRVACPD
ncbi:MAG: hypothetical protein HEQ23_17050 [Tepidisphaera sp.]